MQEWNGQLAPQRHVVQSLDVCTALTCVRVGIADAVYATLQVLAGSCEVAVSWWAAGAAFVSANQHPGSVL